MPPIPSQRAWHSPSGGKLAAGLVVAAGIALCIPAFHQTQSVVEREARFKFESAAASLAANTQTRMRSYADLLYGLQGLFQADPALDRIAFDRYVYSLNLPVLYPGVRAISYVRRVPASGKAAFEAHLGADPELLRRGVEGVAIHPASRGPEHLVLTYIEPLHANKTALGYDLASDGKRMALVDRARDSGMPTLSERLILKSDATGSESGLVMRLALYDQDAFTPDVARRRSTFSGLANLTFQVDELARHMVVGEHEGKFALTILDHGYVDAGAEPKPAPQELYSNAASLPSLAGKVLATALLVDVGQRRWELRYSAPQALFVRSTGEVLPWAAFATVLAVSLLLGGLIYSLAISRQRATALAARMTADLRESQARLAEEQRRTQELIEVLPNPVYFKSTDGRYLGVNKAWEAFFGVPREAFLGKTVHDLYPDDPGIARRLHADDQAVWSRSRPKTCETTITTRDGRMHDALFYKAPFAGADGATAGLVGTIVDITERKQAEVRLQLEHAVVRLLSEADRSSGTMTKLLQIIGEALGCAFGAWWAVDENGEAIGCDDTWCDPDATIGALADASRGARHGRKDAGGPPTDVWASGEPLWAGEVTQASPFGRASLAAAAGLRAAFAFPVRGGNEVLGVMEFYSRESRPSPDPLLPSTHALGGQVGLFIARKRAEERIRHLAHFDELTGLANRNLFNECLRHAVANARRNCKPLVVLFIDLDRFKNINDTLGHAAGDLVLKEVATRLLGCLREGDTVGRLGGDEFVVLLEDMPQPMHGAVVAQKIIDAVSRPITLGAQDYHVTASIGISTCPGAGEDVLSLLKNADIAMYRAKEQGKNNFQFYSEALNVHTVERMALESDLRRALERDQFVLHYQPKVDIRSGRIASVEALVRWQHPERGLVAPMDFIPLAEETGLIVPIGLCVLKTACAQARAWRDQGLPWLRVAVNLSARQFAHETLLEDVARILDETGLDAEMLEFEITESMVMKDPAKAEKLLAELKAMGVFLSIDDFGTGYSSLSYLKRFPIDSLKIDRSFIRDLPGDGDDAAITRAIITMAHGLRLTVIAEGVETAGQLDFLRDNGCNEMQGYHFSRPVPARELARLVRDHEAAGAPARDHAPCEPAPEFVPPAASFLESAPASRRP